MPTTFFDQNGNYYETVTSIPTPQGHTTAPKKPSADHQWNGSEWVYVAPGAPVPAEITFAQLLIGLVAEGWITEAEGDAWLTGTLPAAALGVIGALPEAARFAAKARALRPSVVVRADPLVAALAAAEGISSEQLDQFFITYSQV